MDRYKCLGFVLFFWLCALQEVWATLPVALTLTCPVDGVEFQIHHSGAMALTGPRADLSYTGKLGSRYTGQVHACPQCHFSGTEDDFKQTLPEPLKQKVRQNFAFYRPGLILSDLAEVDLTLQIYHWQNRPPLERAQIALVGSYLAEAFVFSEDTGSPADLSAPQPHIWSSKKRRFYQAMTALYIAQAWDSEGIPPHEKALQAYVAGEMLRRCGQFEQADLWFRRALAAFPVKEHGLLALILQQQHLAREHNDDDTL